VFDDPCSVNRRAEPECKPAWSAQFSGNDCRGGFQNGKTTPGGLASVASKGVAGSFFGSVANKGLRDRRLVTGDSWKSGAKEVDSRQLKVERELSEETLRPVRKLRPMKVVEKG